MPSRLAWLLTGVLASPLTAAALSVKSGASGTLYWDEFQSRRLGFIGS